MTTTARRLLAAALSSVALTAAATGCAIGGDAAAVSASLESAPRPSATELPPPGGGEVLPPDLTLPDVSIPESLPGAEELQECVQLTSAYSEVVVLAFSGDDEGKLPGLFDLLDAAAPDDVRDDLAVVRETVTEASQGGLIDATGALLDEDFTEANTVVVEWLAEYCNSEG